MERKLLWAPSELEIYKRLKALDPAHACKIETLIEYLRTSDSAQAFATAATALEPKGLGYLSARISWGQWLVFKRTETHLLIAQCAQE